MLFFAYRYSIDLLAVMKSTSFFCFEKIIALNFGDWILSFMLSFFSTLILYLLVRTVEWGSMASYALHTKMLSVEETKKALSDEADTVNSLIRLHIACHIRFEKRHKILRYLGAAKGGIVIRYGPYIAIFALLFLAFPHLLPIIKSILLQ